ncbi:MAG TPA: hypothetical protein VGJ70_21730 [Solirubrobacteraceae bacterium]|jgi:hypothetical protein
MTRSLAVAAGVAVLAVPSTASAAELTVSPEKRCYSSGESVNLLGTGFTPLDSATVTRDGTVLRPLPTDANGAFNGLLTFAQDRGRETRTYMATDGTNSSLTASTQVTVTAVRVGLKPANGAPGRVMTITARGFATGPTLWAHVTHRKSTRNLKLGRLSGACGGLRTRKRLLPADAALGVHKIQFDTFRRYNPKQPVRDRFDITVSSG